ncbi:MAG: DUF4276 family protein [Alphaproteobacteria bacterium]
MHFEILMEDQSGKKFMDIFLPRLVGEGHGVRIHPFKGKGELPEDLAAAPVRENRTLLHQLPRLLKGYGKAFKEWGENCPASVIVVCDLDNDDLGQFRKELTQVLDACSPKPNAFFCIAIEEGEAWFLGDIPAIKRAYPTAKDSVLSSYKNDSICGTWECLADAVFPGGIKSLSKCGPQAIGKQKSEWAEKITPHMDADRNQSPSFCSFRDTVRQLAGGAENGL